MDSTDFWRKYLDGREFNPRLFNENSCLVSVESKYKELLPMKPKHELKLAKMLHRLEVKFLMILPH